MFASEDLLGLKSTVDWPFLLNSLGFQQINVRSRRCCCLIHGGDNATAFSWNDSYFYCFSCLKSGDAIQLIQIIKGYDFVEAVKYLADLFGFRIRSVSSSMEKHKSEAKEIPQYISDRLLNQDFEKIQIEENIREIQNEQENLTNMLIQMRKGHEQYAALCDDIEKKLSELDGDLSYYLFQKKH